jgi:bifunctional non-homologous end joining protein LigD
MAKELRAGRVFIDWSQNSATKTTVAAYSLRAKRERPFVSMPVSWKEVERADVDALTFEPEEALDRLERIGDLFQPLLTEKQHLPALDLPESLPRTRKSEESEETVVSGIRLPKRRTQSGRRLFMIQHAGRKEELWLQAGDSFRRWQLHAATTGEPLLTATTLSNGAVDDAYSCGSSRS